MGAMYQVFGWLDNYNMMIKLKKMHYGYVKTCLLFVILLQRVLINELW